MEKKTSTPKKIDITSLKVIDKNQLTTIYGGAAPAVFTSLIIDSDKGDNCSFAFDADTGTTK